MGRERETGREWQQRNTKRDRDQVGRKSEGKVKDGFPWKHCVVETVTGRERESGGKWESEISRDLGGGSKN